MTRENSEQKPEDEFNFLTKLLYGIAGFFSIIGLVIIIIFLCQLSSYYSIFEDGSIELDKTGQVGDFIGGFVGSLWAFAGVILFFLALMLQRKEFRSQREVLQLQKEELKATRQEFEIQNLTLKHQRFENTFFSLLELHHNIVDSIDYDIYKEKKKSGGRGKSYLAQEIEFEVITLKGRDVFKHQFELLSKELNKDGSGWEDGYLNFWDFVQTDFGHYFRNLYRIIKLVNETEFYSKQDLGLTKKPNEGTYIERMSYVIPNFDERYRYTSIVRAQLSNYELLWLFYNCLSENGNEKFKPLVEQYSLLKNLPMHKIHMKELVEEFNDMAFKRE